MAGVPGAGGPVPKRQSQKRGRDKPVIPVERAAAGEVEVPEPDAAWHPFALAWYESLGRSGQAVFYQQSDWEQARIWADILSRQLKGKPSAVMMQGWAHAASELLTTEGARRRLRIELQRAKPEEPDRVSHLDELAKRRASSG